MKRNIAADIAAAAALSFGAAAQTPPERRAPATEIVTVTGCIQPGADVAQPATAPAAASSGGSQFVLSNPVVGSAAGAAGQPSPSTGVTPSPTATPPSSMPPSPTTPTTAPPPTSPSPTPTGGTSTAANPTASSPATPTGTTGVTAAPPQQYRLTGGQNLQQFVNQQVEIRGTFEDTPAVGAATSPADVAGAAGGQPTPRTLHITSVRLLPGSCTGGQP